MYRNPYTDSFQMLPRLFRPSSVTTGWGMCTRSSAPMATRKVRMSIKRMPPMPIVPIKAAAKIGAKIPEANCAMDNMPLARPYCFLETMVVTAAEYAGNWKAPKTLAKAPVTNKCQI